MDKMKPAQRYLVFDLASALSAAAAISAAISSLFVIQGMSLLSQAIQNSGGVDPSMSGMARSANSIGNGLWLAIVGLALVIAVALLTLYSRRRFIALSQLYASQVEKYRQLLAVKQILQAERDAAQARVMILEQRLKKQGGK
jgi:hypothetical protein